jgi:thiosulfate sulfurtransferase|tara:strand:- start:285 stop:578 length:294 start_codon:yes stop_codon:yes gene_type:complete
MTRFERISVEKARDIISTDNVAIVDIRDRVSFNNGHIENALFVNGDNIDDFIAKTDKDTTVIVYCYHGNSSQNAAQFIAEQGFPKVYSMDGGFELWT